MAETRKWSEIAEAGFISGMRFLFWVYRRSGPRAFTLVSWPIVLYYFLTRRIARESSMEFLQKAHLAGSPVMRQPPRQRDVLNHIRQFARSSIDKLGAWSDSRILERVSFPERRLLLEQLDKGEGAILLGGHLGNLEICRSLSRENSQLKLNILVHTHNADMFNKLLSEIDDHVAMELVEVSTLTPATAIRLNDCVQRGEFIAIMADRVPVASQGRTQTVDFLGAPAEFPEGPFILSALLKCPVFTLFCIGSADGYHISCREFSRRVTIPRHERAETLSRYIQRYAKILEKEALTAPYQWFNFYPFWERP